jgi:hypothetical protein
VFFAPPIETANRVFRIISYLHLLKIYNDTIQDEEKLRAKSFTKTKQSLKAYQPGTEQLLIN